LRGAGFAFPTAFFPVPGALGLAARLALGVVVALADVLALAVLFAFAFRDSVACATAPVVLATILPTVAPTFSAIEIMSGLFLTGFAMDSPLFPNEISHGILPPDAG
jgi:hypothetical protein